jgi:Domain of unknown function (DUF4386)
MASRRRGAAVPGESRRAAASDRRVRVVTGALLIVVPVLFNVFFFALQAAFEYPDILRHPTDDILRRFAAGGAGLVALWYGFALVPALFLPAAVLLRRAFAPDASPWLALATPFAVVASVVQLLGLLRWPFLVPELAQAYLDPGADAATRAASAAVFRAFHQYAGVAVGEHLGYLFTGAWTAVIAGAMLTAPPPASPFPRWLGWLGLVAAAGILVGLLEPAGLAVAGTINALSYVLWSLWLLAAGVLLLRSRPEGGAGHRAAAEVDR